MRRSIDFARSGPYFAAFLLVALVAFWPTYLSQARSASSAYTHLHAVTATLWMLMLIVQPMAIRARRRDWHRALGRMSYALVAVVLVSMVLLAHRRIQGLDPEAYRIQTYVLYLQVSLAAVFGLSYVLALLTRRTTALHARFMVCTGLTLIDPVVIRLMAWADPTPSWNYQWFTFGLTDCVLIALIWLERDGRTGRRVFPAMLGVFILAQLPALFALTDAPLWQAFARWFAALPLT
jgi:uncharacterized membrane protein YozB (DUF420 family)